ncbi:MAG TPA: hypothetical protein VN812_23260 [Candidatus Acidoferrales bacterium]|nr:hypothetical protein [Candidatus Acidoferrales bacterium]
MPGSATWEASTGAPRTDTAAVAMAIVENGILAAILGAVVVALWFLLLDIITRGMPFYTPSLLGSIIFAGKEASEVTGVDEVAVFAYTGLHGILFLGAGTILAWMFSQFERNPQVGMILLLLFITFEAILWGVGVSIIPELAGAVGAWAIVVGNVSSAVAMFAFLLRRHPHALERLRNTWQA